MTAVKIALCIATFRRCESLERLLKSVKMLQFPESKPDLRIVVVDNDSEGSAKDICDSARKELRWPIIYCIEPKRGIPFARNRSIECAGNDTDWIAFLDDDEAPEPQWLMELIRVAQEHNADVVAGPVVPRFEKPIPEWKKKGHFFDRKRYQTGQSLPFAYTNNVLFKVSILGQEKYPFDIRFARTGGSDRHFFQRVRMAGYKIVWADEAIVYEWIPPSRTKSWYLIRRQFSTGNGASFIELDLRPSPKTVLFLICKSLKWFLIGLILIPPGLILGRHVLVRGIQLFAYGLGVFTGLFGLHHKRYGKPESS